MPNGPWCHRLVIVLLPRQALRVHILSAMTRDLSPQGGASRRALLGLGAFGIAAAATGCTSYSWPSGPISTRRKTGDGDNGRCRWGGVRRRAMPSV